MTVDTLPTLSEIDEAIEAQHRRYTPLRNLGYSRASRPDPPAHRGDQRIDGTPCACATRNMRASDE